MNGIQEVVGSIPIGSTKPPLVNPCVPGPGSVTSGRVGVPGRRRQIWPLCHEAIATASRWQGGDRSPQLRKRAPVQPDCRQRLRSDAGAAPKPATTAELTTRRHRAERDRSMKSETQLSTKFATHHHSTSFADPFPARWYRVNKSLTLSGFPMEMSRFVGCGNQPANRCRFCILKCCTWVAWQHRAQRQGRTQPSTATCLSRWLPPRTAPK